MILAAVLARLSVRLELIKEAAVTMARKTHKAIRQYSIAVAPPSSFQKEVSKFRILVSQALSAQLTRRNRSINPANRPIHLGRSDRAAALLVCGDPFADLPHGQFDQILRIMYGFFRLSDEFLDRYRPEILVVYPHVD